MKNGKQTALLALVFAAISAFALDTTALDASAKERVESIKAGIAEVSKGAFSRAIETFEKLSDQGVYDPYASYHRAMAYLQRADSPKAREGDLGQAAAGLREAQLLGDKSQETENALEAVRREISRRRAQRGLDPVVVRPPLIRAFVTSVPENVWAFLSLLGSFVLSAGLVLRRAEKHSQRHLVGQILTPGGALLLIACGALLTSAQHYRAASQEAVVISNQARLLDKTGKPLTARALDVDAAAIPEGASLFVTERQGRLFSIHWGSIEAWVKTDHVRLLAR